MNEDDFTGADGTSGCSMTYFLRPLSNIVCLSQKNFELCSFECEYMIYCLKTVNISKMMISHE